MQSRSLPIYHPGKIGNVFKKIIEKKPINEKELMENYFSIRENIKAAVEWHNYKLTIHKIDKEKLNIHNFRTIDYLKYNGTIKDISDELKLFLKLKGEEYE
jgi:hypothetical protein